MTRTGLATLAILAATLVPAHAEAIGDAARGAMIFSENCAACHGSAATGDGPMAGTLATPPRDLTRLGAGDSFPTADTVRWIDGRDIIAHGGPMPLFGNLLKEKSAVVDDDMGAPVFTSQAVLDIVAWLQTIQID